MSVSNNIIEEESPFETNFSRIRKEKVVMKADLRFFDLNS